MAHKLKVICKDGKWMFYVTFSTAKTKITEFLFLDLPLKPRNLQIILFGFFPLAGELLGERRAKCGLFSSELLCVGISSLTEQSVS